MAGSPKESIGWLELLHHQMEDLFHYLSKVECTRPSTEREYMPLVDMFETDSILHVEIDLPGFDKSDLRLQIQGNMLMIEGVKHQKYDGKPMNYICLERNFGRFRRIINLPHLLDFNAAKASYSTRGILIVTFPKIADNVLTREIPID